MTTDASPGLRIAVIGAGPAGLAVANRLAELFQAAAVPLRLAVFEAVDRPGGLVSTSIGNGYVCEEGPETMCIDSPAFRAILKRLGINGELVSVTPGQDRAYVVSGGKPEPLPEGFCALAPSQLKSLLHGPFLSGRGLARVMLELARNKHAQRDQSLESFAVGRFGAELYHALIEPLTAGLFGGRGERLSLRATFPAFAEIAEKEGSLLRFLNRKAKKEPDDLPTHWLAGPSWNYLASFRSGLQSLTDALVHRLPAESLRLSTPVTGVRPGDRFLDVILPDGTPERFDAVCLAVPPGRLAPLVREIDPQAEAVFREIPMLPSAVVNLAYSNYHIKSPLGGSVLVVPKKEKRRIHHLSLSSAKFPSRAPSPRVIVRAVLVGTALDSADDAAVEKSARHDVSDLLGVSATPFWSSVVRHPRSVPVFPVGHPGALEALYWRLKMSRAFLAGTATGIFGLQEAVLSGERAAEDIFKELHWNHAAHLRR